MTKSIEEKKDPVKKPISRKPKPKPKKKKPPVKKKSPVKKKPSPQKKTVKTPVKKPKKKAAVKTKKKPPVKKTPKKKVKLSPLMKKKLKAEAEREYMEELRGEYKNDLEKELSKKKTTKKGGRPSKYIKMETVMMVQTIVEVLSYENFFDYCSVDHVAHFLGINKDTVNEWKKKHKEFYEVMKSWETKRNALFYHFSMRMKPAVWIFLAKNFLKLTDRQITEIEAHGEIIQYVSNIPKPVNRKKKPKKTEGIEYEEIHD
jgi:hypothetical protein